MGNKHISQLHFQWCYPRFDFDLRVGRTGSLLWLRPWTGNVANFSTVNDFGSVISFSIVVVRRPLIGNGVRYWNFSVVPFASDSKNMTPTNLINSCTLVDCTFGPVQFVR